ncbi:MAG: acetyl/propionyl/methylcrotonyl-CoA carboxylase subunit alpha [Hyphomicrobiaceae bacterium]
MLKKILIANRGEIACRVVRTAQRLGIGTVAVYSDADARSLHVAMADEAFHIGPAPASESYLRIDRILEVAALSGADAIHPGYGFLSENPAFAEAVAATGLIFIGPPASAMRAMGLKDAAKRAMEKAGVPVVPGYHGADQDGKQLARRAAEIGYPVLIKAVAGGGGKGMRRVETQRDFDAALASAKGEARSSFGDDRVLIERYVTAPRHIEVQVFADTKGNAVHLFERDCSLQRRHQKVIEEAPAPGMTEAVRRAMGEAAVNAARAVGYAGAGTVEFIADGSKGLRADGFWFMEMNTRLQVEHPVTEAITGQDLVEWQIRVAAGEPLPLRQDQIPLDGHAVEARIYAEDAHRDFAPATGQLLHLSLPDGLARIDTGVRQGDAITPFYDPMIAKVIVHAPSRIEAFEGLAAALRRSEIAGSITNVGFLERLASHSDVMAGRVDTGLIGRVLAELNQGGEPSALALALAAVAALEIDPLPGGSDPWKALSGWRTFGAARLPVSLARHGEPVDSTVTVMGPGRFAAETPKGNVVLTVVAREGVRLVVEVDGRRSNAIAVCDHRHIGIIADRVTHLFERTDRSRLDEDEAGGGDRVMAPLPGLVKAVHVAAGQSVAKGDPLLVLEAMKMQHTLMAPRDGRLAEVLIAAGEQVVEGTMLVALEPIDG